MQRTGVLRGCGLLCATATQRARRGHGGDRQTQKVLERMVLLEQAQQRPSPRQPDPLPHQRGSAFGRSSSVVPPSPEVASFLRNVDDRVARARREIFGEDGDKTSSGKAAEPSVTTSTSLSHFINTCKRMRVDIGLEKRPKEREQQRQQLRRFWQAHADSAVTCCEMRGRDFGFVAGHGLSDDGLHMSVPALHAALAALQAEKDAASCLDVMLSLHFIARELVWWEKQTSNGMSGARGSTRLEAPGDDEEENETPSAETLLNLRHTVTDIAVERIVFFFVLHSPGTFLMGGVGDSTPATDETSAQTAGGQGRGTAQDVLSALEVLSRIHVKDANHRLLATLQQQVTAARALAKASQCRDSPAGESPPTTMEPVKTVDQSFLVAQAFLVLTTEKRRFLNFTGLVQAFALLRIFLPALWPPYHYADRDGRGHAATQQMPVTEETGTRSATTEDHFNGESGTSALLQGQRSPSLAREREALQRITWGLAVALKRRDSQFVNPYHFVKITATLARLPSFTLAPHVPRRERGWPHAATSDPGWPSHTPTEAWRHEMRSLRDLPMQAVFGRADTRDGGSLFAPSASAAASPLPSPPRPTQAPLTPADFWRYMVSKAVIFVPSLPLPQRRTAVRGLSKAIQEKRGRLLEAAAEATPRRSPGHVAAGVADALTVEALGDTAEDILLPLVEEMMTLEEGFDESLRRAGGGEAKRNSGNFYKQRPRREKKGFQGQKGQRNRRREGPPESQRQ